MEFAEQRRAPSTKVSGGTVVLVCWLALIFVSFGLYAPPNATGTRGPVRLCALGRGGDLPDPELDQPYAGWIRISPAPLRMALSQLGQ